MAERATVAINGNTPFCTLNGYDQVTDWLRTGCDPQLVTPRLNLVVNKIN